MQAARAWLGHVAILQPTLFESPTQELPLLEEGGGCRGTKVLYPGTGKAYSKDLTCYWPLTMEQTLAFNEAYIILLFGWLTFLTLLKDLYYEVYRDHDNGDSLQRGTLNTSIFVPLIMA